MAKKEKKPDYFNWTTKEKAKIKVLTDERIERGMKPQNARRLSIVDMILERQRKAKEKKNKKKPKKKN